MTTYGRFSKIDKEFYGIVENGNVIPIKGDLFFDSDIVLLEDSGFALEQVRILPPCKPSKIVAVGLNYRDHALELGMELPKVPIIFIKPSTSVIGHKDGINLHPSSQRIDYEAEVAIVVKKTAKNVPKEKASDYILGYTCCNDVTARDLQKLDGQWTRAKSFDTFCPLGPFIMSDINPNDLDIRLLLNGEVKQSSKTSNLIFDFHYLLSFISEVMTLLPGDVITTGTPSGIGPMKSGDEVVVDVENIGKLVNFVL